MTTQEQKTVDNLNKILQTATGTYCDGQSFSFSIDSIESAISELEMIEVNEHAFDDNEPPMCHFCSGTGMGAVNEISCSWCKGTCIEPQEKQYDI